MKYVLVLADGMADEPIEEINDKTPLEKAKTPMMDKLFSEGEGYLVETVPDSMSPGSDVANLSIIGYNPLECYSGRSPLEALSIGVDLAPQDVTYRLNFVTLSEEEAFEDKKILDHSASEISTEEAAKLLEIIKNTFQEDDFEFYVGTSYRHLMVEHGGAINTTFTPPHDILNKSIGEFLPQGELGDKMITMMKESYKILNNHKINEDRAAKGLNKANCIWLWGEGTKPNLVNFEKKFNKKGTMISAVDLLKGIGKGIGMDVLEVKGATGNLHTNYLGKAEAAIKALQQGQDFVYIHVEAPDECGHAGDLEGKIQAIEYIDEKIIKTVVHGLNEMGEAYKIVILPDHPTPIALRTHTKRPVPCIVYTYEQRTEDNQHKEMNNYCENLVKHCSIVKGYELLRNIVFNR